MKKIESRRGSESFRPAPFDAPSGKRAGKNKMSKTKKLILRDTFSFVSINLSIKDSDMDNNDFDQLRSIRNQTLSVLQELVNAPKPTYFIDNYKFSWNEYHQQLTKTVDWCDAKLVEQSPFEFRSAADC